MHFRIDFPVSVKSDNGIVMRIALNSLKKYLGIYITKEVKDLYNKNYKILM
jgi:hypothetical protein